MDAGATTVFVAARPGDLVLPSYLDVPSYDGVPVEAVTEDLGHGYGNGTPLLTLWDRLAFHETFGVVDTHPDDPDCLRGIRQRPDPATVSTPLVVVFRLILRPSILDLLVPTERARGELDLGELARTTDVRVHQITGHWVTFGEPRRYFDALRTYWSLQPNPTR